MASSDRPGVGEVRLILYVADQGRARDFYRSVLRQEPSLDVAGMTEFVLRPGILLGLMPEVGAARIISPPLPHPAQSAGQPRCELYLEVDDVDAACERAESEGALPVSAPARRDWGDYAGYVADPDGHVLAFARQGAEAAGPS